MFDFQSLCSLSQLGVSQQNSPGRAKPSPKMLRKSKKKADSNAVTMATADTGQSHISKDFMGLKVKDLNEMVSHEMEN
jgi:hypothetical protein